MVIFCYLLLLPLRVVYIYSCITVKDRASGLGFSLRQEFYSLLPLCGLPPRLASDTNPTARAIQIREGDNLEETAFVELIKAVAANNRAGGWRKLRD